MGNENNIKIVEIQTEVVELYKLLKFEGLAPSGGLAKQLIGDGQVRVNGKIETRKRKKLTSGDVIEFDNNKLKLVFNNNETSISNRD